MFLESKECIIEWAKRFTLVIDKAWQSHPIKPNTYLDWFDGDRFQEEQDWLTDTDYDLNLGLLMNIDWWQYFKWTEHSMGGFYCSLLNLPRKICQLMHNIFTLGEVLV